jgi:hypothetical protein
VKPLSKCVNDDRRSTNGVGRAGQSVRMISRPDSVGRVCWVRTRKRYADCSDTTRTGHYCHSGISCSSRIVSASACIDVIAGVKVAD